MKLEWQEDPQLEDGVHLTSSGDFVCVVDGKPQGLFKNYYHAEEAYDQEVPHYSTKLFGEK